jgi:hypothetical protein
MINTPINITKSYWAIIHHASFTGGFNGKKFNEFFVVECDSATELDNLLGEGSVDSGESMGDYTFEVLSLYNSWEVHHQNVGYEAEAKEE